ncbi:MAG: zinc-ribbon domain-containing protein [Proteobacteria bacterium]|jgi:DNA-directed RNA polymerase subunit M/transcription elongation factor TFIIS|nr:zinc-ribbon domain-containing protein [Pseudomonadota bacterium]
MMETERELKKQDEPGDKKTSGHGMVQGANLWMHFNVRCPGCSKLFRVNSREIHSSQPEFRCSGCKTEFSFAFPPANLAKIETKIVQRTSVETAKSLKVEQSPEALRSCPKCQTANPKNNVECVSCSVIMDKFSEIAEDQALGALPSLNRAWKEILADYTNVQKHLSFVDQCEDLQALPYALKKYQNLKEVQPHDELGNKMLHKVLLRKFKTKANEQVWIKTLQEQLVQVNWVRVRKVAPWAMGLMFVLIGMSNPSLRNMAGIGASLLFLTVGMTIFFKGRISLSDFY